MNYINAGGEVRRLLLKPRTCKLGAIAPIYGESDNTPVIPRSEWKDISFRSLFRGDNASPTVLDQDGLGACAGFSGCQATQLCRQLEGQPYVALSPGFLYSLCNGGRDSGASLSDIIQTLRDVGVCKASTVKPLEWKKRNIPQAAYDEAANYKIEEFYDCPGFDTVVSAIQRGFFVQIGVYVGSNFDTDDQGIIPKRRGGAGGHALCVVGFKWINSLPYLELVNSWTANWGLGGFGFLPESYLSDSPFSDSWACRTVTLAA